MTLRLLMGIVGSIIYFSLFASGKYGVYFILFFPYYLSNVFDCSWIYVGLENMLPCVLKNSIAKLVTVFGIFAFVKNESDIGIYIALVACSSLFANLSVYTQLKGIIKKPSIRKKMVLKHLSGSIVLFLPQLASLLYLQMDKAMIEWLTGATNELSFYDQAEKIIVIALSCVTALSTVMMPRIAIEFKKGNKETVERYINLAGKYSMTLACPMAFGIACISLQLVPWYLGRDYLPTAYAMIIISPIVIGNSLIAVSGKQFLTATNKMLALTLANSLAAVANLLFNLFLIPKYGFIGAAIATDVACLMNVIIQYYYMGKEIKISSIFINMVRYVFFAMIMSVIILLCTRFVLINPTIWTTITQILIGIVVYGACLFVSKDPILIKVKEVVGNRIHKTRSK